MRSAEVIVATLVATNIVIALSDLGTRAALGVGAVLGIISAAVVSWSIAPTERARPVLVRRHRVGHAAAAVLAIAMVLAIAGQGLVDGLTAADAFLISAASVASAWVVGAIMAKAFGYPVRVLVVGAGDVAEHLVESLPRGRRFEVVGTVDDHHSETIDGGPVPVTLGDIRDLSDVVRRHRIDLVVFSFLGSPDHQLQEAVREARLSGTQVAVVSRLFEGLDGSLSLRRLEGLPVVVASGHTSRRGSEIAQRVTDIVLSSILLVLTAPVWAVLAAAIKLDSPGPVLYRANRIGQGEQPFKMLKFRKMYDGATGPALTMDNDDRFTRMGRFLAHSKLDELPQLWNVIKGDMSLVGPRPEDARYVRAHHEAYRSVLAVRPGITGLSQIRYRSEFEHLVGDDFEAFYLSTLLPTKLAIDQYYVDHRSWLLDIKCLLWTGIAVIRGGELHLSQLASHVVFRSGKDSSKTATATGGAEHHA